MASSKGAASTKDRKRPPPAPPHGDDGPRPLPPYRSNDPSLDAVLLPLLARAEPGAERALDLEHARARLLLAPLPSDAVHLVALLHDDALDLGPPLPQGRPSAILGHEERALRAHRERDRAARLEYLALLFAAACLHDRSQQRLAEILETHLDVAIKERAALLITASSSPLCADLEDALRAVLASASAEPSAAERNLLSNASRALIRHLPPARALAALRPFLDDDAVARPGGVARAQMILTDLDVSRLGPDLRPPLRAVLAHPALASFACDLFAALPPDPADAAAAAAVLEAQLGRNELPDNYLVWLLARSPHPGASATLLRLLDAGHDPDWQIILDGLKRAADPAVAEPLVRWIERHRKLTGRPGSWEGFEAARALVRGLPR